MSLSGYTVEKQEEGTGFWERVPGIIKDNGIHCTDLEPGKKYNFRVKATNAYGTSDPCETDKPTLAKNPYGMSAVLVFLPFWCI